MEIDSASEGIDKILPSMTTDIGLSNPNQHIVIDTKFNNIIVKGWYREQSLRSGYLYQMYAYLRSQEDTNIPISFLTQVVLLHPCVNEPLDEQVTIQGHKIRFLTVNLAG